MNPQINFLLNKAIESLENSSLDSAELYLNQASKLQSNNAHILGLLGIVFAQRGQYVEALQYLKDSLRIFPKNSQTLINLGNVYVSLSDFENSINSYRKAIKLEPNYAEAWSNIGNALQELKRFEEAIAHYDKALSIKPDYAEAWSNKGNALQELKRFEEAIILFDTALNLKPSYAKGYANKGNALHQLKRFQEAITNHNKALSLNPNYAEAYSCLGVTLTNLNRFEEAIAHHNKALTINPNYAVGWFNKGITLTKLNHHNEAITCYENALRINPNIYWVLGDLVHSKMKVCSWVGLSVSLVLISKGIMTRAKVTNPFTLLSISDDPFLHNQAAHIFSADKFPENHTLGPISRRPKKGKIRIAYFSPDFRDHPVSNLTAELFEKHDRSQFEVFAFSLQKAPPDDPMIGRLKKAFDEFIEIDNLSDFESVQLARNLGVDIAIDLAGFTLHSRTGIFSYRAAPIQVNWLGYAGTTGTNFMDYIVSDKIVIPNSHQHFYSEKVAYLSNNFMVDDSTRNPSDRIFTREECGLPQNSFVFCCFNNDFKFNPVLLDRWSRILLAAENSVLWISENNKDFKKNIRTEFENRNIDSSRIIFAGRVDSMGDYLARYALADLFLDTHPYGAHTTAVDSLKAGVPVLTLIGQSFASRVAASLLNAVGLPELVSNNQEDYERLAIDLAKTPNKLESIKLKLATNLKNAPLFNTLLFAKNLEKIYLMMHERYQSGLEPDHLSIN